MEALVLLIVVIIFLILLACFGHGLWILVATFIQLISGKQQYYCGRCGKPIEFENAFCARCGWQRSQTVNEPAKDLEAAERQLERLRGRLQWQTYHDLKLELAAERARQAEPPTATTSPETTETQQPPLVSVTQSQSPPEPAYQSQSSVVTSDSVSDESFEPVPSFLSPPQPDDDGADDDAYVSSLPPPPRKSFTEVLHTFMEESNIRWGEIVGGLLIIGCSTALVVSLWSEITRIPVVKFLIFTTVTAALFGVGLYTEHRWKLPTTSRGILTIATLLVPLNFLAIAAVSGVAESPSSLIIASEVVAPAVFLCLVYFAGKVLTPDWPHLLVIGVLGSSVGQLLVRHLASPEIGPGLLVALGAFPLACYVAASVWMLMKAWSDDELTESETIALYITLGALTFAAALPFALLLFRTGPIAMTMMYLAPLVSFGGAPLLATGLLLWKRTSGKLVATKTVGTSMALLGTAIVAAGMILAWPNPASIIPAALFNFAVFTVLAVVLRFPLAHLAAAVCFGLAYLVSYHVIAGNVSWLNLRVTSLLREAVSLQSGVALVPLFILFLVTSEWFKRRRSVSEGDIYLIAASGIAVVSLSLVTGQSSTLIWLVYAVYALGAFFIAERTQKAVIHWLGAGLTFAAATHALAVVMEVHFPFQKASLVCGSMFAGAALLLRRYVKRDFTVLAQVLSDAALITTIVLVQLMVIQAPDQLTAMQAQHLFWLAGVWFLLLLLRRHQGLFVAFQVALALAIVIGIKAALQTYEWYEYLPHAWMHPQALQIQGVALVIFCLVWVSVRLASTRSKVLDQFGPFLSTRWAFDRILLWSLLVFFSVFVIYGAFTGVWRELRADADVSFDLARFSHHHVLQAGSWIVLALLLIAFLSTFWQRKRTEYLLGALVVSGTMLPLAAGWWEAQLATASAWRWLAALFLITFSLPLWFSEDLKSRVSKFSLPQTSGSELKGDLTVILMVITIGSILVLTHPTFIFNSQVQGLQTGLFSRLSRDFSYGVPLFAVALVLIVYAIRERKVSYAFVAGLFLNLTASIACLIDLAPSGEIDRVAVVRLIQANAIAFAAFAIVWLGLFHRWSTRLSDTEVGLARRLLRHEVTLAIIANVLVIGPLGLRLVTRSEFIDSATIAAGGIVGWAAFLVTLIAALLLAYRNEQRVTARAALVVLLASSFLVAFSFAGKGSTWWPIHALLVSFTVASWILLGARWLPRLLERNEKLAFVKLGDDWPRQVVTVSAIAGGLTALIALRRLGAGPTSAWWSISTLLLTTALFACFSWLIFRRRFIYIAALLFNLAVSIWWLAFFERSYHPATGFPQANLIALCLAAIGWLFLEFRARKVGGNRTGATFAFHNVAAVGGLLLLSLLVIVRLIMRGAIWPPLGIDWLATAAVILLMAACVWDRVAKFAVAGLYLTGLVAAALFVDQLALSLRRSGWAALMILALYALGASLLWRQRAKLLKITERLRIPTRIDAEKGTLIWLVIFNGFAIALVLLLAFWVDLRFGSWSARILTALAVVAQSLTFALLAEGRWSGIFRRASLAMLGLGLVLASWSFLMPGSTATWLNRAVILMVVMFALTALYGASLEKLHQRLPDWKESMLACIPWFIASGVAALLFSLATEVFYQVNFGAVRIKPLALITIGVTLLAGIVLSVLFALSSRHDPLNLSERGRMNYVYAAEVMLVLLFMHVRLTMPWLFTGFFERYWPIVVMVIAYFGVAVAETLRRRRLLVLAQPLERTGTFLPLLPVIGFWLVRSEVDYSALLFVVGGLYGLLSILRRRLLFGVCAAVAGNAGLWYMLHRTDDFQFVQHPQLWLIPVALSVLIAAYLNEDSLSEEQMAGVRYLSLVTIYASSTADIFLNGVAESPWLPLLLAALSLAGVFSGIVFRIRGFLLLGSVFLLLSIITMIWYASANLGWTWLWYVAGIVTGATIIFMFAVFEKKRNEVLRVVEGFREWER